MKSLEQFIKEQMVCELSSELLGRAEKKARDKAKNAKGHEKRVRLHQADKFAKGVKDAVMREFDEEMHNANMLRATVSDFNSRFKNIVSNIKGLGGKVAKVSIDTLSDKEINKTPYGEWIEFGLSFNDDIEYRVSFIVPDFEGEKIQGFLELMANEHNIWVQSNNSDDELDNAFIRIDGRTGGDGAQMNKESAEIYSKFVNKVLGNKDDYTEYFGQHSYGQFG